MAKSPSHKFGQILGDLLEDMMAPKLKQFADKYGLYLDRKGDRPARPGKKVTWVDCFGNSHDLDFVLEKGGTANKIGEPVAFIESAWRRYTKHSRNKAQEIQGAIQPLVIANKNAAPFIGVVLAGDFTEGSLTQLKSLGFKVLYLTYNNLVEAFAEVGIDARFDEDTPDADYIPKIAAWESLPAEKKALVAQKLLEKNPAGLTAFMDSLEKAVTRTVTLVRILPLYGSYYDLPGVDEAIAFITDYKEDAAVCKLNRYEVEIRYSNGDKVVGEFSDKANAVQFLRGFQVRVKPA